MDIIAPRTLKEFYTKYPEAETPLLYWYLKITDKDYKTPQEITVDFKKADFVGDNRIVFDIAGNKFRLIVAFDFHRNTGFIKFVGTHKEYDKIDAKTVEYKRFNS